MRPKNILFKDQVINKVPKMVVLVCPYSRRKKHEQVSACEPQSMKKRRLLNRETGGLLAAAIA